MHSRPMGGRWLDAAAVPAGDRTGAACALCPYVCSGTTVEATFAALKEHHIYRHALSPDAAVELVLAVDGTGRSWVNEDRKRNRPHSGD